MTANDQIYTLMIYLFYKNRSKSLKIQATSVDTRTIIFNACLLGIYSNISLRKTSPFLRIYSRSSKNILRRFSDFAKNAVFVLRAISPTVALWFNEMAGRASL